MQNLKNADNGALDKVEGIDQMEMVMQRKQEPWRGI